MGCLIFVPFVSFVAEPSTFESDDAVKDVFHRCRVLDVIALERDAVLLVHHRDDGERDKRAPLLEVAEVRLRLDLVRRRVVKLPGEVVNERVDVHACFPFLFMFTFRTPASSPDYQKDADCRRSFA